METNITSDDKEKEEETTKKEEHKSDGVKTQKGGKKSSERWRKEYKIYVYRVLTQVHPRMGVSSKGMTVLNNLMNDMFERLADEAARLIKVHGKKTLSSTEIQGPVRQVFPGELGKHTMAEGTKAGRQSKS